MSALDIKTVVDGGMPKSSDKTEVNGHQEVCIPMAEVISSHAREDGCGFQKSMSPESRYHIGRYSG